MLLRFCRLCSLPAIFQAKFKKDYKKTAFQPLEKFAQLIGETKPDIVSMENVSGLADTKKYPIFKTFINALENGGYKYKYEIVNVSEYGVPQRRRRLVCSLQDLEILN